jgi:hypothetical protein
VQENIPRFCLYHLVPTGRGAEMADRDVTPEQRRSVIRLLAEAAEELKGENIEILTTDSPMDGAYLLELLKDDPRRENVRKLLTNAGGCSTGVKVANINQRGDVHPCHFMPQVVVGHVRRLRKVRIPGSVRRMPPESLPLSWRHIGGGSHLHYRAEEPLNRFLFFRRHIEHCGFSNILHRKL